MHRKSKDRAGENTTVGRKSNDGAQMAAYAALCHPTNSSFSSLGALFHEFNQSVAVFGAGGATPAPLEAACLYNMRKSEDSQIMLVRSLRTTKRGDSAKELAGPG